MRSYRRAVVIILAVPFIFSSCLSSRIHPAGMEASSVSLEQRSYEELGKSEGTASSFSLFWFFQVTPHADVNRALAEAAAKKGGDALIDVRWWRERKLYIVGTVDIIHVRGTVIRYNKLEN